VCSCSGIDPIDNPLEEFKTQCEQCVGVYGGNKYVMGKESMPLLLLQRNILVLLRLSAVSLLGTISVSDSEW